jgi:hypothetical protein
VASSAGYKEFQFEVCWRRPGCATPGWSSALGRYCTQKDGGIALESQFLRVLIPSPRVWCRKLYVAFDAKPLWLQGSKGAHKRHFHPALEFCIAPFLLLRNLEQSIDVSMPFA